MRILGTFLLASAGGLLTLWVASGEGYPFSLAAVMALVVAAGVIRVCRP